MSVNGWLTIMSRINANFPSSLNWTMYKSGFGEITSNFWLGLERIFQLTNINNNGGVMYRLRFELQSIYGR
jgi:Fibrinogen beta and gamma chains, C-terminal globular domain